MEHSVDEEALVARARRGDREAFDRLARLHLPRIYSVAFRLVGNHEDAEDLAQECFVRAHLSLQWYRGSGPFGAWLYRIVVHLARDRFRAAERGLRMGVAPAHFEPVDTGGPARELDRKELHLVLLESLRKLPTRLRTALVLRTLEGLDYADIAAATGVTANTARTQVMRARRLLARLLAPFLERSRP